MKRPRDDESSNAVEIKRSVKTTRPELVMEAHVVQLDFNRTFKRPYDNYDMLEHAISLSDLHKMEKFIELVRQSYITGEYKTLEELKNMV